MDETRNKVLVLTGPSSDCIPAVEGLRSRYEIVAVPTIDQAIELLRREQFAAVFSDSAGFLPLERALVSQQASLILNTIGEGVCIVDGEGRCSWMNKMMTAWPPKVHDKIRQTCRDSFELFTKQVSSQTPESASSLNRSRKYAFHIEDQQYMELFASPVISPTGQVVQVVAVVWDATGTRRLQQKIDAIDRAGRELVRLESEAISLMNAGDRLKLLQDKIISFTRELMHFDHFAIRLLDPDSNKLEMAISSGLSDDALNVELFASAEGNGISGHVAATDTSYICYDVERDSRYVTGLDHAKSSLTVPLRLHDKVIGIFNIESQHKSAFNEDDRKFAEIFGRYVAIALNILKLMVVERVNTSHKVADDVCSEVAGPLNDIQLELSTLIDDYIGDNGLHQRLQQVLENVATIRCAVRQAGEGANTKILGAANVKAHDDPIIGGMRVLVADDELNIRVTINDILRKYGAIPTIACNGSEAIAYLEHNTYDLVVSDIKMPDKSGYEVFAAAHKHSPMLPVILMTGFGYDAKHSIVRASQEGLSAVLYKPFKVDTLLTAVRKAVAPAAGAV